MSHNQIVAQCGAQFTGTDEANKSHDFELIAEKTNIDCSEKNGSFIQDRTCASNYSIKRWLEQRPDEDHWTPEKKYMLI